MSETLEVKERSQTGKLHNRRLRDGGRLPAILYGHGKKPISLSAELAQVDAALRHGAKVVELSGDAGGQAFLQDVQFDAFGQHVLHIDLLRVDKGEKVTVEVPLQTRGEAPGEREGGVVELLFHSVQIETSPANIPETLHVNINQLHLGGSLSLAQIEDLPAEARLTTDGGELVVQCVEPLAAAEEEAAATGGEEPELIGGREEDKESSDA